MTQKNIELIGDRLEREFLDRVRRPGRYIGGEVNQVCKTWSDCALTWALCFPDVYEVGMSNMGLAILYEVLNGLTDVAAERVFAPWTDAEQVLRDRDIPLFSMESKAALRSFDVVAFSLTTELCYTNVLNMLDLGGIPLRSGDRGPDEPLVIAGGGMAYCCEPMAPFIDAFVLGDGEEAVVALTEVVKVARRSGRSRQAMLLEAAERFEWLYVPSLYEVRYDGPAVREVASRAERVSVQRRGAVVRDLDAAHAPQRPIVPAIEAVHERVSVEIMRGCPGRCRFCQVSFCKRPIRYRSVDRIVEIARAGYKATGFDTVSLLSLSSAEYPDLEPLIARLNAAFEGRHVGLSVPSLRVDRQLRLLPQLVAAVRKGGLTIAVEAASERLRQIVNKPLSDEDLFAAVEAAYRAGWQKVKLYFMVGLPSESREDILKIVDLACDLGWLGKRVQGKPAQINAAVSWLVPKPHTPLAWLGQQPGEYFEQAKRLILDAKREKGVRFVQFKFHDHRQSLLESAIGRADRRTADVIESAWRAGARFDLWDECFDFDLWKQAFAEAGRDLEQAATRSFGQDEYLPWEHLGGPDKSYLLRHLNETLDLIQG